MSYISRAPISKETDEMIHQYAELTQTNDNGQMVSPNGTGQVITDDTAVEKGHQHSFENRYEVEYSEKAGLTQDQHNEMFTNPGTFQIEPRDENRSHQFENKDHNDAMQNISAYVCSQDANIAANTYINPSEDGKSGTISVFNAETGQENTLCSYELSSDENAESTGNTASDDQIGSAGDTDSDTYSDDDADTL